MCWILKALPMQPTVTDRPRDCERVNYRAEKNAEEDFSLISRTLMHLQKRNHIAETTLKN